jgi:hypothetical protein
MWAHDLALGVEAELRVLRDLQQRYPDARKIYGEHSAYDLEVPGQFTVEVKFDPASQRTRNIVVEYYHRKVSGLHTSTADWWVFDTGERFIWLTRAAVHSCIIGEGIDPVKIRGPGDRHPKWVFLVPVETISRYSSEAP